MEKPKCEKCISEGVEYSVDIPMYGTSTLLSIIPAFWDKDGKYHELYNPNITTYTYNCSNGHSWNQSN